jgi:alanine dehydrogenase
MSFSQPKGDHPHNSSITFDTAQDTRLGYTNNQHLSKCEGIILEGHLDSRRECMTTVGVPKEVRDLEMRVGLTPAGALALTQAGHAVYVEKKAGIGAGFRDEDYRRAGAIIVYSPAELYGRSDIIAKVTRPTAQEYHLYHPEQIIFSFLHLAVASPDLLQALTEQKITAVAYEMIAEQDGRHPVLLPASEIAGRMAPLIAGHLLRSDQNGPGILLGGIPGVPPAVVVILGGGVLGHNAARAFLGLGAEVVVLDSRVQVLRELDELMPGRITTMFANTFNIQRAVQFADVLVGAVYVFGSRAPILVSRDMVRGMRDGAVIIDFAIDEGGCIETSRPTTLRDPTYIAEGVIHHCVPNLTAACARTTSYAITNAALPYLLAVGEHGLPAALAQEPALTSGIILYQGKLAHPAIAEALGRDILVNPADMGEER